YRHAISQTIPQITRIAWRDKREAIEKIAPGITQQRFVFNLSGQEYEKAYGAQYRKPGLMARFLAFLYGLVPKVGPLRPLQFEAPTPEAGACFLESSTATSERYRSALDALGRGRLELANTDFATGKPSA